MARRKSPAVDAPQTLDEAISLLDRTSALMAGLSSLEADREASLAAIAAAHDAVAGPVEQELKSLFIRLKPWWEVARDQLTDGKRKSVELGGCVIGTRTANPSLKLPKGKSADEVIEMLMNFGLAQFCNVKTTLNKAAIIMALRQPVGLIQEMLVCDVQVSVSQAEEFFIDRLPPKAAATETVEMPAVV
jgi:phage host-nuclease inhibitor protein Gam